MVQRVAADKVRGAAWSPRWNASRRLRASSTQPPARCYTAWAPPKRALHLNPTPLAGAEKTGERTLRDRSIVAVNIPMRFEGQRLLWTIDDVYSRAECREFIDLIERSGPSIAT